MDYYSIQADGVYGYYGDGWRNVSRPILTAPDTDGGDGPPPNDPGSGGHAPTQPPPTQDPNDQGEDEQ